MTVDERFNVLLLGAGAVNFGTTEGPWCHSTRLERKLGERLNIVGLIDPDCARAEDQLAKKRAAKVAGYASTRVFTSIQVAGAGLDVAEIPRLAILGIQPLYRGGAEPGRDAELQIRAIWPNVALFIEKPISNAEPDEVRDLISRLKPVVSVGYMLRYLDAVQDMRRILAENKLQVKACIATYIMAYEWAGVRGSPYFDLRKEPPGPIVTQATHFADLCRYLCEEADLDTVSAHIVTKPEPAGTLSKLANDADVPEEYAIPRVTDAMWKTESGGVCTLVHAVALHDGDYDCELTLITDGWKLRLLDPYGTPRLVVRAPGKQEETVKEYGADDPFYSEISAVIDVVEGRSGEEVILSTYSDALRTYELTRAIRDAGNESARRLNARREKSGSSVTKPFAGPHWAQAPPGL